MTTNVTGTTARVSVAWLSGAEAAIVRLPLCVSGRTPAASAPIPIWTVEPPPSVPFAGVAESQARSRLTTYWKELVPVLLSRTVWVAGSEAGGDTNVTERGLVPAAGRDRGAPSTSALFAPSILVHGEWTTREA